MAYDKVVDSAQLNADLLTIANAIREKAGTSDALAFPAGFAEAIAAISAGGGDIVGETRFISGSFILTENCTTNYNIAEDIESILEALGGDLKYNECGTRCVILFWVDPFEAGIDMKQFPNMLYAGVSVPTEKNIAKGTMRMRALTNTSGSVKVSDWSNYVLPLNFSSETLRMVFSSSAIGYANIKYNWLIFRVW